MASVRNGLVTVTIRLKPETIESLKEISREEGLGYQTHIRNVLEGHVEKNMVGYDCNESAKPAFTIR